MFNEVKLNCLSDYITYYKIRQKTNTSIVSCTILINALIKINYLVPLGLQVWYIICIRIVNQKNITDAIMVVFDNFDNFDNLLNPQCYKYAIKTFSNIFKATIDEYNYCNADSRCNVHVTSYNA